MQQRFSDTLMALAQTIKHVTDTGFEQPMTFVLILADPDYHKLDAMFTVISPAPPEAVEHLVRTALKQWDDDNDDDRPKRHNG